MCAVSIRPVGESVTTARNSYFVGATRFERATPCSQSRCATSCATPRSLTGTAFISSVLAVHTPVSAQKTVFAVLSFRFVNYAHYELHENVCLICSSISSLPFFRLVLLKKHRFGDTRLGYKTERL